MNILVVFKEDYPWDVRVEKLVNAFTEQGHEVTIAANNVKKSPPWEILDGHQIYRLPRMTFLPAAVATLLKLPFWFNPFWYVLFRSMFSNHAFDVVVIRDLPLLKLAILFKKKHRFRVLYDMAEVYPEMYRSIRDFGKFDLKAFLLKNPRLAERYENKVIHGVDHTFTMIEESRDRLLNMNVPREKVSIVSNTPPLMKYQGALMSHTGRLLRIFYVGRLTRLRGIDLLVKGVDEFLKQGHSRKDVKVDIVGTGPVKADLIRMVQALKLEDCISVHGWLDQQEVDHLMTAANVGVVSYRVCGHWNHTIPNKIFDYMLAGIPVLTTPVTTISRIVRAHDCGIVTPTETPEDLGIALKKLTDPELRQKLGNNGYRAVRDCYNWEKEKATIRAVFSSFEPAQT